MPAKESLVKWAPGQYLDLIEISLQVILLHVLPSPTNAFQCCLSTRLEGSSKQSSTNTRMDSSLNERYNQTKKRKILSDIQNDMLCKGANNHY